MKKIFSHFIHGNLRVNKNKALPVGELRRIRFVNYISLVSITTMFSYIILYLSIDASLFQPAITFLMILTLLTFGIIFINNAGFHKLSKILLSLFVPIYMGSVSSWLFGSEPEFHIFLFAAVILPLFIWSPKDLIYLIVFMGFTLLLYIVIEFFPPLFYPLIQLPETYISYFSSTSSLATFCVCAFSIVVYFNLSNKQEKRLEKQAIELKLSQKHRSLIYSVIGHDLKSPLGILLGMSEILLDESDCNKDD